MVDLADAYATCDRLVRAHYENFPVASLLVPAPMRPHVSAVYAFARSADDFADEGVLAVESRERLLTGWRERLYDAASGGRQAPVRPGEPVESDAIFAALGATIRARALPVTLFEELLSAFIQDLHVTRYPTWPAVLDYCGRSANPIGRLILRIAGRAEPPNDAWSDDVCTALQLANFWQDLRSDYARGRIYVPLEVMAAFGAEEHELAAPSASPPWRRAVAEMVQRTRALFSSGRPICDALPGRLRLELRATWLGGVRILDKLEAGGCDPLAHRPRLGAADLPWLTWRLATWKAQA